jgi:hypothetical protein
MLGQLDETQLDGQQLAAVIELGSFDTTAGRLRVTPSAISEHIKVRDGVGLLLNRGVMRNCVLIPLDPAAREVIGLD